MNAAGAAFAAALRASGPLPGAGHSWLRRLRQAGHSSYREQGLPTTRDEAWKYTDLRPLLKQDFHVPPAAGPVTAAELEPYRVPGLRAHRLVFVDGRYVPALSDSGSLPAGVWVGSLAAVLDGGAVDLEPWLGRAVAGADTGFAALNTAGMTDGGVVWLAAGAAPDTPLHLLFVASAGGGGAAAQLRNLVVAGAGSRATVIETYAGLGAAAYLTNAVTEVFTGTGATLDHYRLGFEGVAGFHVGTSCVRQARDSRYISHSAMLGGRLSRHDLRVVLEEAGAECALNGLYVADGRQHMDTHTVIEHRAPHCTSREFYRGVLDGRGRGVFNGRILVHPGAQGTDARQANDNLLLSEHAEVDTKPQLEIYADDVKCAHGATVGQLDADRLFYLRARGLDGAAARAVLVYAFAAEVLGAMALEPVRRLLEGRLTARLLPGHGPEGLT